MTDRAYIDAMVLLDNIFKTKQRNAKMFKISIFFYKYYYIIVKYCKNFIL